MPKAEIKKEKRIRIGVTQGGIMVGTAFAFDAAQGILTTAFIGVILDTFIAIFAWLVFYFWFKLILFPKKGELTAPCAVPRRAADILPASEDSGRKTVIFVLYISLSG